MSGRLLIRRVAERCGLVILGLVIGLGVVEVGLRIGAFVMSRRHALESAQSPAGRVRILSLGDSNTFGLYVGKNAAYPRLLEAQWNARSGHRAIEVINAGYPGNTSWSVRDQLGELLAAYRPDLVTIMLGTNDAWRKVESPGVVPLETCVGRARVAGAPPPVPGMSQWRLVRAVKLLDAWLTMPVEDHFRGLRPARDKFDPAWPGELLGHLQVIAACATRAGVPVVFLTYPSSAMFYGDANDAMRMAAMQRNVPVIDLALRFAPRCPSSKCEYLFSDQHPTRAGHAWIAEMLAEMLPAAVPSLGPDSAAASSE